MPGLPLHARAGNRACTATTHARLVPQLDRGGAPAPGRPAAPRALPSNRMDLSVMFAGTAGSVPSARRGLPALLVRRGAERILVDCGEGTQRQLLQAGGLSDVTDVFITHLHVDHWLGLPGLLQTFSLRDRDRPLAIHGPSGTREPMALLRRIHGRLSFPVDVVELEAGEAVRRDTL